MAPSPGNCQPTGTTYSPTRDALPSISAVICGSEARFTYPVVIDQAERRQPVNLVPHLPFVHANEIDDARQLGNVGIHEWLKEPVQAGGFQVPVGDQHPLPVGGQDPGHVGERHRPSRSAFERVERDDLTEVSPPRGHIRHLAPLMDLAPSGVRQDLLAAPNAVVGPVRVTVHGYYDVRRYCFPASATSLGTMDSNASSDSTPRAAARADSVGSAPALASISKTRRRDCA